MALIANVRPVDSVFNIQSEVINRYLEDGAPSIYPHQRDAVLAIRSYFHRQRSLMIGMVVFPTGCGKTGVAVLTPYALNAHRVMVITPSVTISQQISDAFSGNAEKCFLIKRSMVNDTSEHRQMFLPFPAHIKSSIGIQTALPSSLMVVNAHKIGGQSRVRIEDIPASGYDLVIVDEAHHYPADTWRLLINHFHDRNVRCLFLTATPNDRNGNPLAYIPDDLGQVGRQPIPICYELDRGDAVRGGIIRDRRFDEVGQLNDNDECAMRLVADKIKKTLREHDQQDPSIKHQAMVLTQQTENFNAARDFERIYGDDCRLFIKGSGNRILRDFNAHQFSTLIIIKRLLEGYDNHNVSVVAIVRNVAPTSQILFTQFVGRAVRIAHVNRPGGQADPVTAVIISHIRHNQQRNYDNFDKIAEDDLVVDED